ncbi:carboxypeptidase [Pseudonocardiaceae bacterium YIM PH 21723]|nr:carboxypeptidase [Pseudonocardiaceae bacterium YIM PH 21723]
MSRLRMRSALAAAAVLALVTTMNLADGPAVDSVAKASETGVFLYRVPVDNPDKLRKLDTGFDLTEKRDGNDYFVAGDAKTEAKLNAAGFLAVGKETVTAPTNEEFKAAADTYYGGYHTQEAQAAHLDQVAGAHADLAKVVSYGKTFKGRDMKAICITKIAGGDCALSPDAPKPRFLLMTQIHSREIATGEMSYRFIDELANGYGKDAEITALLDSTEVWVMPVFNADGVTVVQAGGNSPVLQRKNQNPNGSTCSGTGLGVDLNRNTSAMFGGQGSSANKCDETYRGPSANSEAENKAFQSLAAKLFKDQRGPGANDKAPDTATGTFISIHSNAGMNLYPWEYANVPAPNEAGLKAMAQKFSTFNGYPAGQAPQILYAASGGSDDWIYQELGVAASTIELGDFSGCTGFFPKYSCVDKLYQLNRGALLYAAKIAKSPYKPGI